jgi:hypothetical protein
MICIITWHIFLERSGLNKTLHHSDSKENPIMVLLLIIKAADMHISSKTMAAVQQFENRRKNTEPIRAGLDPKNFAKWYCSKFRCYLAISV